MEYKISQKDFGETNLLEKDAKYSEDILTELQDSLLTISSEGVHKNDYREYLGDCLKPYIKKRVRKDVELEGFYHTYLCDKLYNSGLFDVVGDIDSGLNLDFSFTTLSIANIKQILSENSLMERNRVKPDSIEDFNQLTMEERRCRNEKYIQKSMEHNHQKLEKVYLGDYESNMDTESDARKGIENEKKTSGNKTLIHESLQSTEKWSKIRTLQNLNPTEYNHFCNALLQTLEEMTSRDWREGRRKIPNPFCENITSSNANKLGFPGYFDIVEKPMSLFTIKHKLGSRYYQNYPSIYHFLADIHLMLSNASQVCPVDSPLYELAVNMWRSTQQNLDHFAQEMKVEHDRHIKMITIQDINNEDSQSVTVDLNKDPFQ